MYFSDISGKEISVYSFNDIEPYFGVRHEGFNAYFLAAENADGYPRMAVLVNGSQSSLQYFPQDEDPGYISLAPNQSDVSLKEEVVIFRMSQDQEDIELALSTVVSFELAIACVGEFFNDLGLPEAIRWKRFEIL